jgi:hypothetical protein
LAAVQPPEGRRRYLKEMERLLNTIYDVRHITNRVDALTAKLQAALVHDLGTRARQLTAATSLKERIARRAESVREQLTAEATPIQFGSNHEFPLTQWTSSNEYGQASFRRRATPEATLEISAPGRRTHASWRAEVFLGEGDYQLVGRVKLINAIFEPGTIGQAQGVTLRLSGDREPIMIREADDWQLVTYNLPSIQGQEDLVLVCEFRALSGTAVFDASSLKLIKMKK